MSSSQMTYSGASDIPKGIPWSLENEKRIVLVGRTGCGKSASGNTIVGEEHFLSDCAAVSVTNSCETKSACRFGRNILVVDTPGLFDTERSNDEVLKEVSQCIGLSSPGPHAFILVISANRFTEENLQSVQMLEKLFGDDMYRYLIVLFTGVDYMKNGYDDFIKKKLTNNLRIILQRCSNRHIGFNNNAPDQQEVQRLLDMIDEINKQNGGKHYKNEKYEKTEQIIQEDENEFDMQMKKEKEMVQRFINRKKSTSNIDSKITTVKRLSMEYDKDEISKIAESMKEKAERRGQIEKTGDDIVENYKKDTSELFRVVLDESETKEDLIRRTNQVFDKYTADTKGKRHHTREKIERNEGGILPKFLYYMKTKFSSLFC